MPCGLAAARLQGIGLSCPQAEASPSQGAWLWRLKDRIDCKWMAGYGADLPRMDAAPPDQAHRGRDAVAAAAGPEAQAVLAADRMRCGGCGSKVLIGIGDQGLLHPVNAFAASASLSEESLREQRGISR